MKPFKYIIILVIILISINSKINAQEIFNYRSIDNKTYNQYLNKDWKNLIKTGKKSLKNNIDFYYLQVRMGIAYYEQKKYSKAIKYFENSYYTNKNDELVQEYLYFSYIFIGRYKDAKILAGKFNRRLKGKLNITAENPFIKALYIETKHDINEDYKQIPELDEQIYQATVLRKSYYNLSFQHDIGERLSIFHGYSNVKTTNFIINDDINLPPSFEEKVNQNEYYFSINAQIFKGTNISGGFHYIHTNYNASIPSQITPGRLGNNSLISLYNNSENSFAASLNISKQFSIFNIMSGISFSNLNSSKQIQPIINVKIFPFDKSNIYTSTTAMYIFDENEKTNFNLPIFKQSLGIVFLKYSLFEPSISYGDMKNFTLHNSQIANNDLDIVKEKLEALLNFGLKKGKFNIFFKYEYNIKENSFTINNIDAKANYINQAITGGIKWYFQKY